MSEEIWREIPSLPEYEASSWGRVRRIPYEAPMPKGGMRIYGGKRWRGRCTVDDPRLLIVFRGKSYRVSKLVCEAFNGPKPFPRAVAMHADDDVQNNQPGNLIWGTQKENLNAPAFLVHCRSRIYEHSGHAIHRSRAAA